MRPTRTQAIKTFLIASTKLDLASLYNHDMEVQVNVAQDAGSRIDGDFKGRQWHGYTDGFQIWKPIRIPYNANSEPEYVDVEITYDLAAHAEGIGMTGWDWSSKLSRWVAFDFDAISGHSDKHGKKMTDEELVKLREVVEGIEWVTLRRSTSGRGLHVYVFLLPVSTNNHNEHAALARAVLSKMSAVAGFDFAMRADIVGGNMWVWHRKMLGTSGLELLKVGTTLDAIPTNWRDHVKVVTGRRKMSLPKFIEDQESSVPGIEDKFTELTGQRVRVPLDQEHKRLLEWLDVRYPNASWWDSDNWMLVTHTTLLAEAHDELSMRGLFATVATGRDRGNDWNVYLYPLKRGAWAVRRYSPGCAEHPLWIQDGAGWTLCYLNRLPDLKSVCRMFEAQEDSSGWYHFPNSEQAKKAALHLGADLDIPNWALVRKCKLKEHRSGRLVVELKHEVDDPPIRGWLGEKSKWQKLFEVKASEPSEPEVVVYDDEVRHLITESGEDYGWVVYSDGIWHSEPYQNVKCYLSARGHSGAEATNILGSSVARHWTMVNLPFEPEYPKDRRWNRGAAQLRYKPIINRDDLKYGTWLGMLGHLGQSLDDAIKQSAWASSNGVLTGADYLKCWVSSLFKYPCESLPYLFFYGPQDSGKSIFHEALQLLVLPPTVVVRADTALTSQSNFNGELENCILAVIEETDLQRNRSAYNRIKDWVTSLYLPIHKKQRQPYTVKNTTHWIQCANSSLACVPKETWVQTSEGPRQVSDLIGRAATLAVDGCLHQTEGFHRTGYREVFRVETDRGYCLDATADHLVMVSYDGLTLWQAVSNLRVGDSLCLHNHSNLHWEGQGDFGEGYVVGTFLGDGSHNNRAQSSGLYFCADTEPEVYIQQVLQDFSYYAQSNGTRVISGSSLRELLQDYGLQGETCDGHGDKVINSAIETASSDFYCGFLSGLFDTDGCGDSGARRVRLSQSDKLFLQTVQRMLLRLGITSSIGVSQREGYYVKPGGVIHQRTNYCLGLSGRKNLERFNRRIGFKISRKGVEFDYAKSNYADTFHARVLSVRSIGFMDVYDATVPQVEMFDANGFKIHNCPVFVGDTRITMCYVPELAPSIKVPKREFLRLLEEEAADFMTEILNLELPPSNDRLNVPVIRTEDKALAEEANQTFLEIFLKEKTHHVDGKRIAFSDLYERFTEWLDPNYVRDWSKIRFGREMPPRHPKGRLPATGQFWYGNISWEPRGPGEPILPKLVVKDGKLIASEETNNEQGA